MLACPMLRIVSEHEPGAPRNLALIAQDSKVYIKSQAAQRHHDLDSVQQFQLALHSRPDDANVEANLGSALAEMGRLAEAKSHFERALQIDPNQALAKENLEILEKMNAH